MGLTHAQVGWLAFGVSAGVIAILCVTIVAWGQSLPFTFTRLKPPSADLEKQEIDAETTILIASLHSYLSGESVEGEYEQYGELYVSLDKRPTIMGIDIMTRMLMVTGLPPKAVPAGRPLSQASSVASGPCSATSVVAYGSAPHLSVDFGSRIDPNASLSSAFDKMPVVAGSESQLYRAALRHSQRFIENMRAAIVLLLDERNTPPHTPQQAPRGRLLLFPPTRPLPVITPVGALLEQRFPAPSKHEPTVRASSHDPSQSYTHAPLGPGILTSSDSSKRSAA